jgi:Single-strand binding protein family
LPARGAEDYSPEQRRALGCVERRGLGGVARLEEPVGLQQSEHAGGDLAGDGGHLFRRRRPDGVEDRSAVFLPHRVHALQDDRVEMHVQVQLPTEALQEREQRAAEAAAEYLDKGSLVSVEGALRTREWTDGEGARRVSIEIHARPGGLLFLDRRPPSIADQLGPDVTPEPLPDLPPSHGADHEIPF